MSHPADRPCSRANASDATVDQIPCDSVEASGAVFQQELTHMLADCTRAELRVITETVRARKDSLRQMPPGG